MADVMTHEQRSRCMAAIKSKGTKPEMEVRRFLFSKGLRYRVNNHKLPGSPDIVLKKYRTVIFIDGCFWHGHKNCKASTLPTSNTDFWRTKIESNIERDTKEQMQLEQMGYKVFIIWQCQLKSKERENTLQSIVEKLTAKN